MPGRVAEGWEVGMTTIGKHRGKSIKDVVVEDPRWIAWAGLTVRPIRSVPGCQWNEYPRYLHHARE